MLTDIGSSLTHGRQPHDYGIDLTRIEALMQSHLNGELDLDTIAAEANLSKFHFSRQFKALTGSSPIHRFIELKLQRACHLLDTTSMPIKAIALQLGYDDPYYFSRLFRREIGLSPKNYRDSHRA